MTEYEFPRHQIRFGEQPNHQEIVWDSAAEHRAMVTRILIDKGGPREGKLAVLGAGLCNDISLAVLREWYQEIHLFDLDGKAVWNGVDRQGFAGADWIKIHGNVDVTGTAKVLFESKGTALSENQLTQIVEQARESRLAEFSSQFDMVASTCLLSQVFEFATIALGHEHPRLLELLRALRQGHLMTMVDLCKPGGTCNLVFDFVSSVSLPEMVGLAGETLTKLLSHAIEQQNFFRGMNPVMINETLVNDPYVAPHVSKVRATAPWIWNANSRHYAVSDVQFKPNRLVD